MIIGFAIMHSITKSKLLLVLCLYVSVYEVVLIVKGTAIDESVQASASIDRSFDKESLDKHKQAYELAKDNYDNPESKVYHNSWYKQKTLDPAWAAYEQKQAVYESKIETGGADKFGMLKIFYRLGLVFLCMISIHYLINSVRRCKNG
jgi:hypothetical protein